MLQHSIYAEMINFDANLKFRLNEQRSRKYDSGELTEWVKIE